MRVDNTGILDITSTNIETKGAHTVGAGEIGVKKNALITDTPYSVTAATVEKALFSLESELDRVKQDAQSLDVDLVKRQMAVLSNTLSGEDLKKLQEEGYSLNETDIETIVTVVDKIKMELAKGGMDISVFGDDLSMEQLEAMTGSASQAKQMASELTDCEESDIAYLVENDLEPTIENLYWAKHSGNRQSLPQNQAIIEDENLKRQIEQVIEAAGLPVDETTMGYAQLLLNNGLPLTVENISYTNQLTQLKLPPEEKAIEKAIATAVYEGKVPQEAYLLEGYSYKDRAIKAQEVIENAKPEDLLAVTEQGEAVTVENLARVQQSDQQSSRKGSEKDMQQGVEQSAQHLPMEENIEYISARRRLEEARLVMTVQANYQLLKQGISIDTMELEQLVEELKSLENSYYKNLLSRQGIEPTSENTEIFRETMIKTGELQGLPAYLIGRYRLNQVSVQELHTQGCDLKAILEQANEAYETMMTSPRKDMGDSIQKAFRNVDDILTDLDMEITPVNQRAVRILAYNQMEITSETIAQIKEADEKLQNLFRNMKPQVVMEMIREGVHPLSMDVEALNAKAEEISQQLSSGKEEQFSQFLWELEQNHEITPEEKESYIGIFRLLRQIEKTDGAVVGALVNQGAELSLKNLLSAVRSRRTSGMNIKVDDNFGGTTEINRKDLSINQQIDAAYQTDCAKEALAQVTPELLKECTVEKDWQSMTPEQLLWSMKEQLQQKVALEQTMQPGASQEQAQPEELQESYFRQQIQQFGTNQIAEDAVLKLLNDYNMPMDTYHIMAAGRMLNNRNSVFRKLFQFQGTDQPVDLQEAKEEVLRRFAEAVKTPEDMAKAQQALAETAEQIMENMINEPDISSMDVRELKVLRTELELNSRMSKEENYAIPVVIADELTNVQLKIVRGKQKRGMVDILFDTEKLGKVAARIQVSQSKVEGFVAAERKDTLELLREQEAKLSDGMKLEEGQNIRFDFVNQQDLNLTEFSRTSRGGQSTDAGQPVGASRLPEQEEDYQVQTAQLYTIARTFLEEVKRLG